MTAWELAQQGISHDIIADNAAGFLMSRGEIDLVIVGSDRTLGRTGEVADLSDARSTQGAPGVVLRPAMRALGRCGARSSNGSIGLSI